METHKKKKHSNKKEEKKKEAKRKEEKKKEEKELKEKKKEEKKDEEYKCSRCNFKRKKKWMVVRHEKTCQATVQDSPPKVSCKEVAELFSETNIPGK